MSRDNPRKFTGAAVSPFGSGRLWVNVDHGDFMAFVNGANSQIKGNGRFADATFFRYNGDYIHVYTYTLLLDYEYICFLGACVKRRGREGGVAGDLSPARRGSGKRRFLAVGARGRLSPHEQLRKDLPDPL
jgi:hypothetical protein